jgi:5-methylcytosine-specific restriction endonuclease McrA
MTGKAEIVETYDRVIRGVSITLQHPKVIKLVKYVKVKRKLQQAKYSRKNILARDKMICQYCGIKCTAKTATLDHVVPKSRGGENSWTNIVTSCKKCNNKKDNKTPAEARMKLLSVPKKPTHSKILDFMMPK